MSAECGSPAAAAAPRASPIWSHIVPQVLAMNSFYHSQSHSSGKNKQKTPKPPNVSTEKLLFDIIWCGWSSRQLRGGCQGAHRDGFSLFLGSTSPYFTGITPRVEHPTLELLQGQLWALCTHPDVGPNPGAAGLALSCQGCWVGLSVQENPLVLDHPLGSSLGIIPLLESCQSPLDDLL